MDALDKAAYQNIQTAFSAQTSANQIQDLIDAKLDKRRKVSCAEAGWPSSVFHALLIASAANDSNDTIGSGV